jgi:BlaI family transcriptional regulator, penicillinase repressor
MSLTKILKPTEGELEILQVLWNRQEAGYTTTLKLMQIMFEKGLVTRDSSSKTHIYKPAVSREKTQSMLLNKMIDSLFGGSSAQLVMQALGNHKASKEELDEISNFLKSIK